MAVAIYKKGQGYYTRVYTAISYALLVLWGALVAEGFRLSQSISASTRGTSEAGAAARLGR